MKKIPTLYLRDWGNDPRYVTRDPNPDCAWVLAGEGTATRKYDGTCVMYDGARWWARREVKPGKVDPPHFLLTEEDETTGKRMGWEPIEQSSFAKPHAEAVEYCGQAGDIVANGWPTGTYELIGPKINGNPERYNKHFLMEHGWASPSVEAELATAPRDYDGLREWLHARPYEGIVWHHPDGRLAKLKARDMPKES
jgi:hypothetical protein